MKDKIILVGGGGHCKSCIDVIEAEGKLEIEGIIDLEEKLHRKVCGYEIIACDEDLPKLVRGNRYFLVTLGQIKRVNKRKHIFEYLKKIGANLPVVVSPLAYVSKHAFVDEGTIIMNQAFINSGATVGKNCIVNTGVIVEHDTTIGSHCHISTGCTINGECSIGEETFIGSNSVIVHNIEIVEKTIIGAGSVVVRPIRESGTYVGNTARKLKQDG